jgi:hypothetical protein
VHRAPGIPHALTRAEDLARLGRIAPRDRGFISAITLVRAAHGWKDKLLDIRDTGSPHVAALMSYMISGRCAGITGISRDRRARIIDPATVFPIY